MTHELNSETICETCQMGCKNASLCMDSLGWFNEIARRLLDEAGLDATVEQMGGGILNIVITVGNVDLRFGTANETWGADVYRDGEFVDGEYIETHVLIVADVEESALTIMNAVAKFEGR
jgi:hypothetical protein